MAFASQAVVHQAASVAADLDLLAKLFRAVNYPSSFSFRQWCHFYAIIHEFRPDLVLEIGRGLGGSTAAMTQAAQHLDGTRVKSWCITDLWARQTVPKLKGLVPPAWFDRLDAYVADVQDIDFADHVRNANRAFFFWDTFHHRVNERVLTHLLPLLAPKTHIVAIHDVSDNRYYDDAEARKDYDGKGYFRSEEEFYAFPDNTARVNIGWVSTITDGALPILDFCYRNNVELHSADHELFEDIMRDDRKLAEVRTHLSGHTGLPEPAFAPPHHFAYFSLNEAKGPHRFPAPAPERDELEKMRSRLYEFYYAAQRRRGVGAVWRTLVAASDVAARSVTALRRARRH